MTRSASSGKRGRRAAISDDARVRETVASSIVFPIMSPATAFGFLSEHPVRGAGDTSFIDSLRIEYADIAAEAECCDGHGEDEAVWLEAGPGMAKDGCAWHDWRLDVAGPTFDDALVALANRVGVVYGTSAVKGFRKASRRVVRAAMDAADSAREAEEARIDAALARPRFAGRLDDGDAWQTAGGNVIAYGDLSTSHVANILSLLVQEADYWMRDRGGETVHAAAIRGTAAWTSLVAQLVSRGEIIGEDGLRAYLADRHRVFLTGKVADGMADFEAAADAVKMPSAVRRPRAPKTTAAKAATKAAAVRAAAAKTTASVAATGPVAAAPKKPAAARAPRAAKTAAPKAGADEAATRKADAQ
jgi:hypothetical protein